MIDRSVATETQLSLGGGELRLTRFSENRVPEHLTERRLQLWAKQAFRRGDRWRVGHSTCTDLSASGISSLFDASTKVAEASPLVADYQLLPWAEDYESSLEDTAGAYDPATTTVGPAFCVSEVADIALPCRRLGYTCTGYHALMEGGLDEWGNTRQNAVCNNNELFQYHKGTRAVVNAVVRTPSGGLGTLWASSHRAAGLQIPDLLERAILEAERPAVGAAVQRGTYRVVLGPEAVADLFRQLAPHFNGRAIGDGSSHFARRVDEPVLDSRLSVRVYPAHDAILAAPFDAEGWPRREVLLVQDGQLLSGLNSRAWANETGGSAHGYLGFDRPAADSQVEHLVVEGGDLELPELLATVDRGIYLRRFPNGLNWAGLTASGIADRDAFFIRSGSISGTIPWIRFSFDLDRLLNRVVALGTAVPVRDLVVPAMVTDGLQVPEPQRR